ncbi:uncharacterized protein LOC122242475 [Penaeus japonicus]|uniref:uncharacterized protein LOC122242475 n=1 Tax=Penaeus japonicus TaxID=27405 RepID=UPI001C71515D|nr:uncharacterized protein LOC122242475 [Penaeus japonicus]
MQPKHLLSLAAVTLLSVVGVQNAVAQEQGCYTSNGIVCYGALSIAEIQHFLKKHSVITGTTELNILRIDSNPNIQHLPAGLLADLRFSEIVITSCPQLSRVDDIMGASSASVKVLQLHGNALTEMPKLTAPGLAKVTIIQPTTMTVSRSAFSGMKNIQELHIESASVRPLAFFDLKKLQTLRIISMPQETVRAQSFSFDSPVLKEVLLFNDVFRWKGQAEPGAYQGFPKGSRLKIIESETLTKEVYLGVLSGGGHLEIPEPFDCDCRLAWLRFSPLLKQTSVRCLTGMVPGTLEDKPESDFSDCK